MQHRKKSALQIEEQSHAVIIQFLATKIVTEFQVQQIGRDLMLALRRAPDDKLLIVDFKNLDVISSAMIGKLVVLNRAARKRGIDLRLANVSPNVLEVFQITKLHKTFRIDDDLDEPPEFTDSPVPRPKPPDTLNGRAEPPKPDPNDSE